VETPPEEIDCGAVRLRRWTPADLPALAAATLESWAELRRWMPWAQEQPGEAAQGPFLASTGPQWDSGEAYQYAILPAESSGTDSAVLGSCGLMRRVGPGGLEIGYWVRTSASGRGVATVAAAALTSAALQLDGVDHVEIHCDAANVRSAAVPARLGYRLVETGPRDRTAPGESGQGQVWRVTAADWTTGKAAGRWRQLGTAQPD